VRSVHRAHRDALFGQILGNRLSGFCYRRLAIPARTSFELAPLIRLVFGEREVRLIRPKNRGPDQWAPVIRSAIIDSER
jgi:hypothetical protein